MPASGIFGSGQEYSEFVDLNKLGAVVTKGVSYYPWEGNPTPRIMETSSGMINAVGLQNPGIDVCSANFLYRSKPVCFNYGQTKNLSSNGKEVLSKL